VALRYPKTVAALQEHRPHGKDHDQGRHGAWADGAGGERDGEVDLPSTETRLNEHGEGGVELDIQYESREQAIEAASHSIQNLTDHERAYIVSEDGRVVAASDGAKREVDVLSGPLKKHVNDGGFIVHNHPTDTEKQTVVFLSIADFVTAWANGASGIRAVSGGDQGYRYHEVVFDNPQVRSEEEVQTLGRYMNSTMQLLKLDRFDQEYHDFVSTDPDPDSLRQFSIELQDKLFDTFWGHFVGEDRATRSLWGELGGGRLNRHP